MAWPKRSIGGSPHELAAADLAPGSGTVRSAGVAGLGCAVPDQIVTNHDLARSVDTSHEWIVERTGIVERRIAAPHEATSDFAIAAARRALADAGLPGDDVDLVIVATVTPDHPFPAVASQVQQAVGASHAGAFDLAAGCSGFIYALAAGSQFIASGFADHVLVLGAETLSRIVDWTDRATCVLFGDGAGAVVLSPAAPGEGFLSFDLGSDGGGASLLYVDAGGSRKPATRETVDSRAHTIKMAGREVFKWAVQIQVESALSALRRAELTVDDVDCFIAHQANLRIIDAAAKRLGVAPERVIVNVDRYGNTSAASIPLALDEARQTGRLRPGDIVVTVGFGAGLSWGSAVLKWGAPVTDA
ncbi:MAG: ketoacyl-ACP synthase III [Armatimonadetes bacterium]|nr:ketoacyl-ACP synthase III [Armatimonadota bacterium]